jgi:hypothetical protein
MLRGNLTCFSTAAAEVLTHSEPQRSTSDLGHLMPCIAVPIAGQCCLKLWVTLTMANILCICLQDKVAEHRESLASALRASCQAVTMDTMKRRLQSQCQCYSCTSWYHQKHINMGPCACLTPHCLHHQLHTWGGHLHGLRKPTDVDAKVLDAMLRYNHFSNVHMPRASQTVPS